MLLLGCSRLITALVDTAVSFSRVFEFSFLLAVVAWMRQHAFALLSSLLLNVMLIYSCAIYAFAWLLAADCRSGRHRRVVWQGFLRVQLLIAVDALPRQYAFALPSALLLMTDIQLCLVYVRFAVVPPAQCDFDIQLRHTRFRLAARG